jgi:Cu+-exporting ATPase
MFAQSAVVLPHSADWRGHAHVVKSTRHKPEKETKMNHLHQPAAAPTLLKPVATSAAQYTCPMHPEVRKPQPGNCPKCGMTLVPVA